MDGSQYGAIKASLAREQLAVQKNALSSDFIITDIHLMPKTLKATVTGVLHRAVAGRTLKASRMTYELSYRYRFGRLSIVGFTKLKEQDHA